MNRKVRVVAALALLCASVAPICAQEIDFGQIDKFESLGTGTLHVGAPPKTIIDDDEPHTVISHDLESDGLS